MTSPAIILIVDDHATNRKLLRAQLEAAGHTVLDAADGVEALAVLEREPVDAIISDILMPNLDGFNLCRQIRRSEKFGALPLILYTNTYDSPNDRQLAEDVGADCFLAKPASPPVILAALREAIEKAGERKPPQSPPPDEACVLREYSEVLVRKLKEKNAALQESMEQLRLAHEALRESQAKLAAGLEQQVQERTRQLEGAIRELNGEVTKGQRATKALIDSELRYRRLFEAAKDGILILDAGTGMIVDVNPFLIELLGFSRESFLSKNIWELGFFKDIIANEANFVELQQKDYVCYENVPLETTDGRRRDVEFISNVYRVNAHKVVQCNIRDITERKRRQGDLRQALATLDATEDGAFIFDPETLRHSYVNQGAVRQLGYTREELLDMTAVAFKPEFTEAHCRELLAPMLRGEVGPRHFTTLHRHKDGHDIPVEINLQYITPKDERPRFIAIARDITERQKHEHLALRSQRLESIGTLAGGVAHDLNNALAPILMGVELLKMQYPKESQIVDMFETSAKRGADMVRQLLTFAKGAEGERVLIQPRHLVKELENLIKGSFPKNIRLVVKCDPKLPTVLGDATQVHQILLNLCVNARDAMPHGGTLTLEVGCMAVDATYASSIPDAKPGKYLVLRVRDTGTGIPPEILDRIFDPFFTTKGPDKGTGLGLSTVMGTVKGHSGFLQVYSQLGQGSTFAAYLPAASESSDTEHLTKAAVEFRGQGETILLVDDEATVREVARAVLRHLNFKPLTATDGADGLIQAAQHRTEIHAIITDLHMPHLDGLAFARAVRRLLPDIPIMVASGRMEDALAEEFKTLGVTSRLDKPFTKVQLAEALKNLLAPK